MILRKLTIIVYFTIVSPFLIAQKIQIAESSETIENVSRSGLYTVIDLDSRQVEKAWERHLKTFGKLNSSKGYFILPEANVPQISSKSASVYSKIQSMPQGTKVWWAIDLGDSYASNASNHSAFSSAEKELHEFASECYKNDINEQIKDAEKAHTASIRFYEKEVKRGEQLNRNVANNLAEKAKLEEQLKQNAIELEQLKKEIEFNKNDQAEGVKQMEKMKDAIVVVKEKLNHVQ